METILDTVTKQRLSNDAKKHHLSPANWMTTRNCFASFATDAVEHSVALMG